MLKYRTIGIALVLMLAAGSAAHAFVRGPMVAQLENTSAVIAWESARPATATLKLMDETGKVVRTVEASEDTSLHEVHLDNLERDTRYQYEVIAPGGKSIGAGRFQTAPAPGEPLTFALWGDSRSNPEMTARLSEQTVKSGVPFILHSGDIIDDGRRLDQWQKQFFTPASDMLRNLCFWPAVGNHDVGNMPDDKSTMAYKYLYSLPDEENYYSFDYGNAHFLVLDSENDSQAQYDFAVRDLESSDADWLFVMWHRPVFSSGQHESDIRMRNRYCPLIARHNVDLLVVGHNHNYMLTKPIRHVYEKQQTRPYRQLVTGGGGAYPGGFRTTDLWFDRAETVNHYVLVTLDGETLTASVRNPRGREIDRFTMDRDQPAEEVVPYEQIQLEHYLQGVNVTNMNVENWPTGLLLEPGAETGELHYAFHNPLPEPLNLKLDFSGLSKGIVPARAEYSLKLKPEGQGEIRVPVRVESVREVYPLEGPAIDYKATLGSGSVTATAPILGVARIARAAQAGGTIEVDGKPGEDAWKDARDYGRFALWSRTDIVHQPAPASSFKVLNDGTNLYLLLHRPRRENETPESDAASSDKFDLFLATDDHILGYQLKLNGETSFAETRDLGLGDRVEVASSRDDSGTWWELRIPVVEAMPLEDESAYYFNIMEQHLGKWYTFSPTFRHQPNRETAAQLVLAP